MKDDRLRILRMLSEGKLDAAQADELISLMEMKQQHKAAARRVRWFRVRVMEKDGRHVRTNVRMPAEVMEAVLRLKAHLAPEADVAETQRLLDLLQSGAEGGMIEYEDPESGRVEISVE